jgi:ferredoxin-thioredoxin reductase catalytic subunit
MSGLERTMKMVNCICGHTHAHKSRCKINQCRCRYGTDNRKASDRIICGRVGKPDRGMKALKKCFAPDVIVNALKAERSNEQ